MLGVFISYGRRDDEPFVERLYADLAHHGIALWRDREAMRSRGRSFVQEIQDGIADFDRLLLVVGPYALDSEHCRMEWEFALQTCRIVVPLFRGAGPETLPASLRSHHGYDFTRDEFYGASLKTLLVDLGEPAPPLAALHDVIALPPHFLGRPAEFGSLYDVVGADTSGPDGRIIVLHGMPGSGKTSLATALARSCAVRRSFPGGVFWFALGQERERPEIALLQTARAEGRVLIVLDDVWHKAQVEPVLKVLAERDRLLLTTRRGDLAAAFGAPSHHLDPLDDDAALELLARWSGSVPGRLDPEAVDVARECGNLPLSLAMVGALVGSGASGWAEVLVQLRAADLAGIEQELQDYPHSNLLRVMQVSVNALPTASHIERYLALAVFCEDRPFPASVLALLWGTDDPAAVSRQVALFVGRSLLQRDAAIQMLLLHDLQRDYLRAAAGDRLAAMHGRLLDAYRGRHGVADWLELADDGYLPDRLAYHLAAAGRIGELRELFEREQPGPKSAWQLARSARDPSGGAFRGDLAEWWHAAERIDGQALRAGEPPGQLPAEMRCALTSASLTAQAGRLSPTLLRALVAAGVWPAKAAEAAAWQMPSAEAIAEALEQVAPLLDLDGVSKAFRWYLHGPQSSFSSLVLMALARRLAALRAVDRAIALARRVRLDKRNECDQRIVRAFIEAGHPDDALKVLLSLPDPQRWGQLCWDLAKQLPPPLLPQLQTVTSHIVDERDSPYRSWIEATLAPRWLDAGEIDLAEQAFAAIDQADERAKCVQACASSAPAHWVSSALQAAFTQDLWDWQRLAALHALAGPAITLGIEAPLVQFCEDATRRHDPAERQPLWTAKLLFAVGVRLHGATGERLRTAAGVVLAQMSDPELRCECLRTFAAECTEPERSAFLRAAHAELARIAGPDRRCERLVGSLDTLAETDRDAALISLADRVDALDTDAERHAQAEKLCAWCAKNGRVSMANELAERFDQPGGRPRHWLLRTMASFAPAERLDTIGAAIPTLGDDSARTVVTRALANRLLSESRVDDAIDLVSALPLDRQCEVWEDLLPRLSRSRARLVAGGLLQQSAVIDDGGWVQSMQCAIAGRLAARGRLAEAIEVLGEIDEPAARFEAFAFLAYDVSGADCATLRAAAGPLGEQIADDASTRASSATPLAWSLLGQPERALAALERLEESRDWERQMLVSDPGSTLSFDQRRALAQRIDDGGLRLAARLALWMRYVDRRQNLEQADEQWGDLWQSAEGRFALATCVARGFGASDPSSIAGLQTSQRGELLKRMLDDAGGDAWPCVERHLDAAFAADGLAPRADAAFAVEAVHAVFDEGPLVPDRDSAWRLEPVLAWLCRRLGPDDTARLGSLLRTRGSHGREEMQALAQAQFLGILVLHGRSSDPEAIVDEIVACAAEVEDEFWAREPLYRIHRLLPAPLRSELSARAPYFLLQALRTEDEIDVWQFAALRLAPALLALDTSALHLAWADLLHELSTRDRKSFWQFQELLVAMVEKLGGDAALAACAHELRPVQRLWP